jgi:5-formyltetrahydrofolate cyclo-ligase
MNKSELRHIIRECKRQYSSQELKSLSLHIIKRIEQHPKMLQANTVLLYYSLPDEVYTHSLIEKLYKERKEILLPKVVGDGEMELRVYEGKGSMHEGAFHIMEPSGLLFTNYKDIDLAIVPGMSFDKDGNRLGRGKGYYDRFLAQAPHLYKIGVCFDFQKVGRVPFDKTDIPMDEII